MSTGNLMKIFNHIVVDKNAFQKQRNQYFLQFLACRNHSTRFSSKHFRTYFHCWFPRNHNNQRNCYRKAPKSFNHIYLRDAQSHFDISCQGGTKMIDWTYIWFQKRNAFLSEKSCRWRSWWKHSSWCKE